MVTENEQIVDTTPAPEPEVQEEQVAQEPVAETTEQPVAEETAASTEQPQATEQPVAEQPTPPTQFSADELQQINAQQQQQLQQYQQMQAEQQLKQAAEQYQRDLEDKGYAREEASNAATEYYNREKNTRAQQQQYQQQQLEAEGKRRASLFYAKKYGLTIDDIPLLDKSINPQEMENMAKRMDEDRKIRNELNTLKQQRVPSQQFDTNQPAASAAGSEEELLDQYNSGVRNPQTEAAARRAAGLG